MAKDRIKEKRIDKKGGKAVERKSVIKLVTKVMRSAISTEAYNAICLGVRFLNIPDDPFTWMFTTLGYISCIT